jgi:hypothetical protein
MRPVGREIASGGEVLWSPLALVEVAVTRSVRLYAVLAAAVGAATMWGLPAGAAGDGVPPGQQLCPGPNGVDPDTVTLSGGGASLWPPNGRATTYTLTAAETSAEQAGDPLPHYVTLDYRVTASPSGAVVSSGSSPNNLLVDPSDNNSSAAFSFRLPAVPLGGDGPWEYLVSWNASFDGGIHTCSSSDPGEHMFMVRVAPPA